MVLLKGNCKVQACSVFLGVFWWHTEGGRLYFFQEISDLFLEDTTLQTLVLSSRRKPDIQLHQKEGGGNLWSCIIIWPQTERGNCLNLFQTQFLCWSYSQRVLGVQDHFTGRVSMSTQPLLKDFSVVFGVAEAWDWALSLGETIRGECRMPGSCQPSRKWKKGGIYLQIYKLGQQHFLTMCCTDWFDTYFLPRP